MISRQALRILQIEDDPTDAELIHATLRAESLDVEILLVDTEQALKDALDQQAFDLVLADYRLPGLNGATALRIVRNHAPDLPFILVTGTVGEEVAVEMLKLGATDFVLKGSLARLALAVRRAIEESNKMKILREAERALRESEEKYRTLVEQIPAIVYIAEPGRSGKWHYVSSRIESILGFTPQEWLENPELWFSQILPEDRAHGLSSETKFQDVFVTEYRMQNRNGEIVWFRDEAISLKDAHGGKLIHGLMIDITDLKNAEEARLSMEQKLRRIQKAEVLAQLAGGVAHDFNNILMVIGSYCEILQMNMTADDPHLHFINEIKGAADKGAALTRQLLDFSRRQQVEPRSIDLNQLITGMHQMIHHLVRENIEVSLDLQEGISAIKADPAQIERLIINLVVNARDAMPNGGSLKISTGMAAPQSEEDEGAQNFTSLSVADTGIGMTQQTLNHIFEPFFTTKEEGKGTGLGLSTTHAIVHQNAGQIEVFSELGKGTTFRILFPAQLR